MTRPPEPVLRSVRPPALLAVRPEEKHVDAARALTDHASAERDQESRRRRPVVGPRTGDAGLGVEMGDEDDPGRVRAVALPDALHVGKRAPSGLGLGLKPVQARLESRLDGSVPDKNSGPAPLLRPAVAGSVSGNQAVRRFTGQVRIGRCEDQRGGYQCAEHRQSISTPIILRTRSSSSLSKKSISRTPFVCLPFACVTPLVRRTAQPRCFFSLSASDRT